MPPPSDPGVHHTRIRSKSCSRIASATAELRRGVWVNAARSLQTAATNHLRRRRGGDLGRWVRAAARLSPADRGAVDSRVRRPPTTPRRLRRVERICQQESPATQGFLHGQYWARTSDPQLVDSAQRSRRFPQVRLYRMIEPKSNAKRTAARTRTNDGPCHPRHATPRHVTEAFRPPDHLRRADRGDCADLSGTDHAST
jgi:hypothetical protein